MLTRHVLILGVITQYKKPSIYCGLGIYFKENNNNLFHAFVVKHVKHTFSCPKERKQRKNKLFIIINKNL